MSETTPVATTPEGAPLFVATDVVPLLGHNPIADQLSVAATVIQDTHQTGMETFVVGMQRFGYTPEKRGPGSLPDQLHVRTRRLARDYLIEHEKRVESALESINSLQSTFPDLLYSVYRHDRYGYLDGTRQKVIRFQIARSAGSLLERIIPVFDRPLQLAKDTQVPIAVCDVQQLGVRPKRFPTK